MAELRWESELNSLLTKLKPAERRKLARQIATELRRSQQQRIAAQLNPDGTPYAPRKPQLHQQQGALRRGMFAKLRTAKYLKIEASPDLAVVGFVGRVSRIARVHQEGLRDRIKPSGVVVQYVERQLLGLTEPDITQIRKNALNLL
ncbi:phage virion morphogenesis protein [Chitinivorax sp. B]|uniref:phage virion morphogenesis protein n=1 Tax=Chitinivorax sp. B TaxID=2502235 RepID=UPI0010F89FD9|nr:phage virion morphogenesis protein [Chitinivorax sp. B]